MAGWFGLPEMSDLKQERTCTSHPSLRPLLLRIRFIRIGCTYVAALISHARVLSKFMLDSEEIIPEGMKLRGEGKRQGTDISCVYLSLGCHSMHVCYVSLSSSLPHSS